jgi:hypothetical protein
MTRLANLLLVLMTGAPVAAFGNMGKPSSPIPAATGQLGNKKFQLPTMARSQRLGKSTTTSTTMSMSMTSVLQTIPRGGAAALAPAVMEAAKNWNSSPSSLFNTSLMALALVTTVIKVIQRASAGDQSAANAAKPKSVKDLQIKFLSVFWLLRCADWLQGPYFYQVYASKMFNGVPASMSLVSQLFLTGFASTALFGPLVGKALDIYGRKKGTLAFSVIYALGAISTKSPLLKVLFLGRLMSGIGTSLLFTAPESWMVGEAQKTGDDPEGKYLGETFGMVCSG